MGHSFGTLYLSFVISTIGLVLFGYGRKQARFPQLVVGLVLLVYPYFVPAVAPMLIVAAVLVVGLVVVVRLGW